jgi:hypothetical protein
MMTEEYPTDEELERIKNWPMADPMGWLDYCASIWHWGKDYAYREGDIYYFHTGGWSGNEDIIGAMRETQNGILWMLMWSQSNRGGHYIFSHINAAQSAEEAA